MGNPELERPNNEHLSELESAASERSAELAKKPEASVESSPETRAERAAEALSDANKEALLSKEAAGAEKKRPSSDNTPTLPHATKRQRAASYDATMRQIRKEMSVPSRTFSRFIHNKTVEEISESIGQTVARPNAMLAGSIAAMFITLFVFLIAKQYGYRLSGFETIGTFLFGWAVGLVFDYARLMFPTKR